MIELTLSTGDPISFKSAPVKKFRGPRLPGAELWMAGRSSVSITEHQIQFRFFSYALRSISCKETETLTMRENSRSLRLEFILTGRLNIRNANGSWTVLNPGEYHITDSRNYQVQFSSEEACQYFVAYVTQELIHQNPAADSIVPCRATHVPLQMAEVIEKILDNPYSETLRDAFYDHSIRELLFIHLSAPTYTIPGELTAKELALVNEADNIIAKDLTVHFSIQELARQTKTNIDVLKRGFAKVYGMGPFERLLQRKMDKAKNLLETTDKQIQDIAALAGYETVTGFINAFRKKFSMSPRDWRKRSRGII